VFLASEGPGRDSRSTRICSLPPYRRAYDSASYGDRSVELLSTRTTSNEA